MADAKDEREESFAVTALCSDEPQDVDGVSLVKLQESFFETFEQSLYLCPMVIGGTVHAHFYAAESDRERRKMLSGFVYGFIARGGNSHG